MRVRMLKRLARVLFLLVTAALPAGPALACTICVDAPKQTLVDRLLAADTLVLARPDPGNVYRFVPVALLRGKPDAAPIPHLADSATRQRLANAPEDGVVVARLRPPADGLLARREAEWVRLGYGDRAMRGLVAQILDRADLWRSGASGRSRFDFFADLHDHADPAIREIAISEIARAPYAMLRTMTPRLTAAQLAAALRDPALVPWASTYVLLLGRTGEEAARNVVRDTVAAAAAIRAPQRNLAAWATAWIEIEGLAGVEMLARGFLHDRSREKDDAMQVVAALALHAREGDPALARTIAHELRELARHNADLAPAVAVQLGAMGDWSMAEHFAGLLAAGKDWLPEERFALAGYVAMSEGQTDADAGR